MKLLHSQVQQPTHVIPHSNAFAFYISLSHLVISLYQFENLQSTDASLQEPRGMLLRPSQPMA